MMRPTRRFTRAKKALLRRLLEAPLGDSRSMLIIFALMLLVQGSIFSQSRFFGPTTAAAAAAAATSSTVQNSPNNPSSPTTNVNQTLPAESSQKESPQSGAKSPESNRKANSGQQQQVTILEQQPQSTDVSSMYVQIPIAEPADAGLSETNSGADSEQSNADSSKATSWTGPWPKKFQIGYIKQSDLHQVLIESLKNDPFVSLGGVSQGGAPSGGTKTATSGVSQQAAKKAPSGSAKTLASDSASLMSAAKQQQTAAGLTQWPLNQAPQQTPTRPMSKNVYMAQQQQQQQPQQMNNFREAKLLQQQQQQQQHQRELLRFQQQMNFNQQAQRAYNQQPKMLHFNGQPQQQQQQQQQFQFANFPTSSFKNQPIYTISNGGFPSQAMQEQTPLVDPMQVMVAPQSSYSAAPANANRGTKQQSNDYHYSSWRPVTSDTKSEQPDVKTGSAGQFQTEYQAPTDNFDDGFSAPSKDASSAGSTMNRHPMLNNYLSSSSADLTTAKPAAKLSPAVSAKMKLQQQQSESGTKGAARSATKSATKGFTEASQRQPAAKGQQTTESGLELSVNRRRSQPNNSTTSSPSSSEQPNSTTTASSEEATTTGSPASSSAVQANATQTTTTTTTSAPITSTAEGETQEPDSEVIDSDTTEPTSTTTTQASTAASSTTSQASVEQQQQDMGSVAAASGSSSTTTSSSTTLNNGPDQSEAEVVTQGAITQQSTASLPALPESGSSESPTRTTASSQSTTSGVQREETTPQSGADSTSGSSESSSKTSGGEVEEPTEKVEKSAMDASMSDEALLAASVRTGADLSKTQQLQAQSLQRAKIANSSGNKKARSSSSSSGTSERLVQASNAVRTSASKLAPNQANKLITKRPQAAGQRQAKQVADSTKGGGATKAQLKAAPGKKQQQQQRAKQQAAAKATNKPAPASKSTRMAPQSERLQQQQVVSMSAAQAQATAQTLASLLLARCMSSSGCAHLLDICTTKQAAVPLAQFSSASQTSPSDNSSLAWSMPGLTSSGLGGLTQALQADRVLRTFPQWKEAAESLVDQDSQSGYTLILPSNEALERLPEATVELWLSNSELMAQIIDAHLIDSAEQIDFGSTQQAANAQQTPKTRLIKSKALQVNQHRDKMVTINGKRLVYANQAAPSGGRIHVIDGFLDWPTLTAANSGFAQTKPLDIMDTLKQCDKFDGFVTLAEGTGLTQILKQDGPMTVFVPSNEALRKIPDEELEVIKNNSTALKEFLMYHVVNGSYFSQDLRDGQQLASILDMRPIQVGVRVDGCSRRLVEANTSPMRRPDIVAKNGVIHILDWYLTVRDNEWCDPIGRSSLSSSAASLANPNQSLSTPAASERLQQLASETSPSYATRMTMPANHKPAQQHSQLNEGSALVVGQQQQSAINHKVSTSQSTSTTSLANGIETHSIIVSATPLAVGDVSRAAVPAP